jgi:DNA-directed RNA polymerase sigma subunit (sigma70/sigma32)
MAQPKATRVPANIVETVNKVVRTSHQMLPEIGREPTPEELAEKLAMPLDTVHKVLTIAKRPIRLEPEISDKENPDLG